MRKSKETRAQRENRTLQDKLDEERKGRISIVKETEEDVVRTKKKGLRFGKKDKTIVARSKKEEEIIENDQKMQNFVHIRKVAEGFQPLHELPIIDKVLMAIKWKNYKTGATARKEEEKLKAEVNRKMAVESQIKRNLTKYTDEILKGRSLEQYISVKVDPKDMDIFENVIQSEYFTLFNIEEIPSNPNLHLLGIYPPTVLRIGKKEGRI